MRFHCRLVVFGFLCLLAQGARAGALDALSRFLESTRTLRADFTQIVVPRNGGRTQQTSGVMMISRPGKFRWQIDKPYPQLLVGDGEKVWIYDPDLKQVTVKKMGSALGSTPAALLIGEAGGRSALEKNFVLSEGGRREGLDWLEAKPRSADGGFTRLQLGFEGDALKAMVLEDSFGQTTTLHFQHAERNTSLAPSQFRFTPPAGVDVLSD